MFIELFCQNWVLKSSSYSKVFWFSLFNYEHFVIEFLAYVTPKVRHGFPWKNSTNFPFPAMAKYLSEELYSIETSSMSTNNLTNDY